MAVTPTLKFNFKDIVDLNTDIKQSPKSLPIIVQRVLSLQLRALAKEMRPQVPRGLTGALSRSFGASITRRQGIVSGVFGFLTRRRAGRTIVAGNVLQKGGATPRKRAYLWIPVPSNRNVTPQDFFNAENTFVRMSKSGNKIAFIRQGNIAVPLFVLKKSVRFASPPLPIDERVEARLPEMLEDIEDGIGQVIAARRVALGALSD